MLDAAKMRVLPVVARTVDYAPAAQACCGACRTCVQTNLVGAAFAAISGAGVWMSRRLRRR